MAYENPLMTELMVPRDPMVAVRLHLFYEAIRWDVHDSSKDEYYTYVSPEVSEGTPPTIAYWQTVNEGKIAHFVERKGHEPSVLSSGLRLPMLNELVEVCLVVPSNEDVHAIFERGGNLLERHTHILPRDHAGSQEFRFADPFNYSLRVTANHGWEIAKPYPKSRDAAEGDIVRPEDFLANWNESSALICYAGLLRVARQNEDFPLQPVSEDSKELRGDIVSALQWLRIHKKRPSYYTILERLV